MYEKPIDSKIQHILDNLYILLVVGSKVRRTHDDQGM